MSDPHPDSRLHGLDALRAGALLLGVVLHACMSYMPGASMFWIASDKSTSAIASGLSFWIHSFRMLLFFFLAGYFGRFLIGRYGIAGFVRNRARRVLVPLLAGWPVVLRAITAVAIWGAWVRNGVDLPATHPPAPTFRPESFPLTHLWFLYVLALFYVAVVLMHMVARRITAGPRISAVSRGIRALLLHPVGRWLVALPAVTGLLLLPSWLPWFGIPTPDQSLYPNVAATLAFGSAFAYGWIARTAPGTLTSFACHWKSALLNAIAGTAACLWWIGAVPAFDVAAMHGVPYTAIFATLYVLTAWAWVFALLGLVLTHANRPSRPTRYIADASLWIYVAHLPVVAAGQVLMSRVDAPVWLELPAIVLGSVGLPLGAYELLIRGRLVGRGLGLSIPGVRRDTAPLIVAR